MREVMPQLLEWWRAGETVGVGTVVATFQSAPRPPGASMLVGPDDSAVGSVSGGCVEGAVYETAKEVVASGTPTLERYGVSDDDAFAVGLTCGGILDVYIEKVSQETFPELEEIAADLEAGRPVALVTVIEHPDPSILGRRVLVRPDTESSGSSGSAGSTTSLGSARMDDAVRDDALGLLAGGTSATLTYGPDGERRGEGMRVFVWAFAPKPRMLVFGAIDFAAAVARVGSFLGYHVTVCDARPVFATHTRFPDADEVVVDWPHRYLQAEVDAGRIDQRTVITVLHADLYGDEAVTLSTLKAEVSHLRSALAGQLTSRPYRLAMPVTTDVDTVLARLRSGDVRGAVASYGGDLLPGTNSPRLTELAEYVAVAVREALLTRPEPSAVLRYAELAPYDTEVLEACVRALGTTPHPALPLLKGRLAAAR